MAPNPLAAPSVDPTPIFEVFRGNHATELLTAAVAHLNVFGRLAARPMTGDELRHDLGLAERPAVVLLTALRAMGLLADDGQGRLGLTPLAREHLVPGGPFDVSDYVGLAADSPGVREMVERLRTNRPAGAADEKGAAFIYREGIESAMEREATARHLTLALAGRAKNVAAASGRARRPGRGPAAARRGRRHRHLQRRLPAQKNPDLRAVVWDRPEVLKVAAEFAAHFPAWATAWSAGPATCSATRCRPTAT